MSDDPGRNCGCSAVPAPPSNNTASGVSHESQTELLIGAMDCPTEETLIRSALANMPGVGPLEFNLMRRTLRVTHEPERLPAIIEAIRSVGFHPQRASKAPASDAREAAAASETLVPKSAWAPWWPLLVSGAAAVAAEVVQWVRGDLRWLTLSLAVIAIMTGGLTTYKKGWIALRHRNLNMNALMSIAVTGAMLIGEWPEAAVVMALFALAELIENRALERARRSVARLLALAPETATVQQPDGSWREEAVAAVSVGAIVRVRPGERIALDGVVLVGRSTVNQAPITGESLPVEKTADDPLFAGTINEAGSLEYRVTALARDSTLARIVHAVESAQSQRAPTQRFVDRFARVYTPAVFAVALAIALAPPLFFGVPWLPWTYKALVLLVIACPCALVISTPVTIVSGLTSAARHGVLVKGGLYLEAGPRLAVLALDKTGTLTTGKPVQTDYVRLTADMSDERVQRMALSLAARSDHPVSAAIAAHATRSGLAPLEVQAFEALGGRGIRAELEGQALYLGNDRLMQELGVASVTLAEQLEPLEHAGKSVVVLADSRRALALFAVGDTVRPTSRQAIAELHALGVHTVMLSGDNVHTTRAIAAQVGIEDARGNLLPADKLRTIEALMQAHGPVGMVGDGINDAPALARADIGFAMGAAGTDTAIETADVALMDDDLRKIPAFIRLSRSVSHVLRQNIALALGIKAVFLVLAVTGQATMWMAVFADMGASLIVVGNGLRLLRDSTPDSRASVLSPGTSGLTSREAQRDR
jgi:Cd2+/Zn2+-exporting ATPase